jgi:succinate-semialdehyde dehydrogenase/glutarate-semialdehyde dehydrogenase
MATLKSINPSNYHVLGEVEVSSPNEIVRKVQLAKNAQKIWRSWNLSERIRLLKNALTEFESNKSALARLVSREMGMPITEALAVDFQGGFDFSQWYLDHAEECLKPETTYETPTQIDLVYYEPRGAAGVIIPWNYPFLNFIWSSIQNLIAGNTVVLKHSEECPLSGRFIEEIMSRRLIPGVFSEIYGDGKVGQLLMQQDIDLIHFVGSAKTGWLLYEQAAQKRIKAVMELGGSAPGIIFNDADIDAAVKSVCDYRLGNAGQWCDGLKRLIVQEKVFDEVVEKIAAIFKAKKIGVAEIETTELGPLAAKRQLDRLVEQVSDASRKSARFITGGHSLESKLGGAFHEPTVLIDVTRSMKVWREEVFGPVLPVMKFSTEQEAVELANDTEYGLGAYVYTQNRTLAERMAQALKSGMVSINGTNYTAPWNPFGGFKNSGLGREHGQWGFHEVTQPKVISLNK